jgi:hypothetical protein
LGGDVNRLIGQINDPEVNKISIPVSADIDGTFNDPKVKTDLASGIKNLTNQLLEIQKQRLIGKGKDKINDILSGVLGGYSNSKPKDYTTIKTDSTKNNPTDKIKEGVNTVIGGILGGKKTKKNQKEQDSTKNR